jgi:hypothetical protein
MAAPLLYAPASILSPSARIAEKRVGERRGTAALRLLRRLPRPYQWPDTPQNHNFDWPGVVWEGGCVWHKIIFEVGFGLAVILPKEPTRSWAGWI